jgi:hypothetical protein
MGQDDTGKAPAQNQAQDQDQDQQAAGASPDAQGAQASIPPATTGDQSTPDDLLHAAHVAPPDMVANVELTLDQLSATVDLFDVPPFDHGDTGGDVG